jgi:hypothetical protein
MEYDDKQEMKIPAFHSVIEDEKFGINESITITFAYLLLPKYFRRFVLWHEYGHYIFKIDSRYFREDQNAINIYEAMAHFYACCKCKMHFNTWYEITGYKFDKLMFKLKGEKYCNDFDEKYRRKTENIRVGDYVYLFYRDINRLKSYYGSFFKKWCFHNNLQNKENNLLKKFNWKALLKESGWENDETRWRYIDKD